MDLMLGRWIAMTILCYFLVSPLLGFSSLFPFPRYEIIYWYSRGCWGPFALAADGLLDLQPRLLEFHSFCLFFCLCTVCPHGSNEDAPKLNRFFGTEYTLNFTLCTTYFVQY
jgi:hypothetical protein